MKAALLCVHGGLEGRTHPNYIPTVAIAIERLDLRLFFRIRKMIGSPESKACMSHLLEQKGGKNLSVALLELALKL